MYSYTVDKIYLSSSKHSSDPLFVTSKTLWTHSLFLTLSQRFNRDFINHLHSSLSHSLSSFHIFSLFTAVKCEGKGCFTNYLVCLINNKKKVSKKSKESNVYGSKQATEKKGGKSAIINLSPFIKGSKSKKKCFYFVYVL
jgi:hypothetical protein